MSNKRHSQLDVKNFTYFLVIAAFIVDQTEFNPNNRFYVIMSITCCWMGFISCLLRFPTEPFNYLHPIVNRYKQLIWPDNLVLSNVQLQKEPNPSCLVVYTPVFFSFWLVLQASLMRIPSVLARDIKPESVSVIVI